ncbi:hypothetical protein HDU97_002386 [Phlyctochytrium planicorne]|nr:hypothetical protein HDU97_002386 [Phlyctochytrium planicorne]
MLDVQHGNVLEKTSTGISGLEEKPKKKGNAIPIPRRGSFIEASNAAAQNISLAPSNQQAVASAATARGGNAFGGILNPVKRQFPDDNLDLIANRPLLTGPSNRGFELLDDYISPDESESSGKRLCLSHLSSYEAESAGSPPPIWNHQQVQASSVFEPPRTSYSAPLLGDRLLALSHPQLISVILGMVERLGDKYGQENGTNVVEEWIEGMLPSLDVAALRAECEETIRNIYRILSPAKYLPRPGVPGSVFTPFPAPVEPLESLPIIVHAADYNPAVVHPLKMLQKILTAHGQRLLNAGMFVDYLDGYLTVAVNTLQKAPMWEKVTRDEFVITSWKRCIGGGKLALQRAVENLSRDLWGITPRKRGERAKKTRSNYAMGSRRKDKTKSEWKIWDEDYSHGSICETEVSVDVDLVPASSLPSISLCDTGFDKKSSNEPLLPRVQHLLLLMDRLERMANYPRGLISAEVPELKILVDAIILGRERVREGVKVCVERGGFDAELELDRNGAESSTMSEKEKWVSTFLENGLGKVNLLADCSVTSSAARRRSSSTSDGSAIPTAAKSAESLSTIELSDHGKLGRKTLLFYRDHALEGARYPSLVKQSVRWKARKGGLKRAIGDVETSNGNSSSGREGKRQRKRVRMVSAFF